MYYAIIILVIIIVIYLLSKNTNNRKIRKTKYHHYGANGEWQINTILERVARKTDGVVFLDVLIRHQGHTCQIDNILLTKRALYVIESKDYSGWIFGSENNVYWRQTFTHYKARTSGNHYQRTGVSRYSFYNPIKQNQTHINMLRKKLYLDDYFPIFNIVVFGENATLKDVRYSKQNYVVNSYKLASVIEYIEDTITALLSDSIFTTVYCSIQDANIIDPVVRREHIDNVQNKYGDNPDRPL